MQVTHRIVLHFPPVVTGQPITYQLMKDYNLAFNILKASIGSEDQGLMVLELSGEEKDYSRAVKFLNEKGVRIQPLVQDIRFIENNHVHCGACVGVCPSGALYHERPSMLVLLDPDKCVACGECVKACPVNGIELTF